ncbi:IS110 family transposase [Kiritimatiellota bacterium B12222]|nr:IS110 family transposase [Kiritimatiellota bacterium B12222]
MNGIQIIIGIDVSKASLQISTFDKGKALIPNTAAGIRSLINRTEKLKSSFIFCCEATGGYERLFVDHCHTYDIPVAVLNARQVRDFARSKNILAKTDAIDAEVIRMFAENNDLRLYPKPESWRLSLQALLTRRDELKDMITQERNRLETLQDPLIRKMIKAHLRSLASQDKRLIIELKDLVSSHESLRVFCDRLISVKDIGLLSALSLFAYLPELGQITDNQAAALAGLAPWCQDSGNWKGERHISGGRSKVRRALYMPAINASTSNPILKEYYQKMIRRGKPAKVALTAVMRKMVCLANKVASDPDFIPA